MVRRFMTELHQGLEDLFAVVLYRLLLACLLPLALAWCRNFFFRHFSGLFFPQVVQHGDFQLRSIHATSNRSDGARRHRISCHAAQDTTTCAAFIKESRMNSSPPPISTGNP